ncbi:hypothetical protein POM88_041958 [Heracleum sosnowskyi]|uniref:ATP-dependent DNA helicase n=1 Tax=Heracleum sosnowskyi TaxID=360622 RepID=A0AAD8HFE0_9APIA|nr:hypothetical protein POM88_041958 [Heracleum sosnowskyi]
MRINKGRNEEEVQSLATFAKWVLDIGDGKIKSPSNPSVPMVEDDICIPKQFCNLHGINSVDEMIESNFPDLLDNFQNPKYLSERAILSPTNQTVGHVNSSIVEKLPGEMFSYFSIDTAEDFPVSRVTSPEGLRLFINDDMGNPTFITQNVVYKEVFYNVMK